MRGVARGVAIEHDIACRPQLLLLHLSFGWCQLRWTGRLASPMLSEPLRPRENESRDVADGLWTFSIQSRTDYSIPVVNLRLTLGHVVKETSERDEKYLEIML